MNETLEKIASEIILALRILDEDADLIGILIGESVDFFKQIIGQDIDFESGLERSLLKDRIRYAYNNCLEDFTYNFLAEIETLQVKYAKKTNEDL